jgi:hypothetical protein
MKKMKLAVEELRVDSFETNESGTPRGTVAAHGVSGFTCVDCRTVFFCDTVPTRDGTCCTPIA